MKTIAYLPIGLFRTAGILFFLMLMSLGINAGDTSRTFNEVDIQLNPQCKIKRFSNGEVLITSKNQEGLEVKHKFTDFYADLLLAAYHKQHMEFMLNTFSKKYTLSQDDCRREIKHAINVLVDWNIIVRDNKIALR
jgi:hypothetical protein